MSSTNDARIAKTGQSLTDLNNQAESAIAQLNGIKTNLLNLRNALKSDTANFTTTDEAEVNKVITDLATKIQAILS